MSLRARTLLLVLVPLAGLAFFAGWGWVERTGTLGEAEAMVDQADLLSAGGELIHALQLERGLTAGWLAGDRESPDPDLMEARDRVDVASRAFQAHAGSVDSGAGGVPLLDPGRALAFLEAVPVLRDEVDRRGLPASGAAARYTDLIRPLVRALRGAAQRVGDRSVASYASTYTRLLRLKEAAGVERATLYAALSRGSFLPGERDILVGLAVLQDEIREEVAAALSASSGRLPEDLLRLEAVDPSAARAMAARDGSLARGPGGVAVSATEWFGLQTERIELLREMELQALGALEDHAGDLRDRMARERATFALAGMLIVVLTLGGAALSVRSIRRPLGELREALEQVGEKDGIRDGRLGERGPPETVAIARAFNAYADRLRTLLRRIEESEAKFAGILEISVDAVISVDEQMEIVHFNEGAEQIFGYESHEAIGSSLDILLPKAHRGLHQDQIRAFAGTPVRSRRMGERGGISGLRKSGEEFPAEASISKLKVGGEWLFTVVLRDITERMRAEEERARLLERERHARKSAETAFEEARKANRHRDEILGMVTHDLRSPLTGIVLGATAALRRGDLDEEAGRRVTAIRREAERMSRLIQDLLDVASIGAGQFAIRTRPCDAAEVIRESTELFQAGAEDRNVELEVDVPGDLPGIRVDRDRISQVVGNLLSNALKFTPEGGKVVVRATTRGAAVRVSVRDTGPGIPPKDQDQLFHRFWQPSPDRKRASAGLGLAIARGIVEAHGGEIWVESEDGQGSTFHFTVPTVDPPRPTGPAPDREVAPEVGP